MPDLIYNPIFHVMLDIIVVVIACTALVVLIKKRNRAIIGNRSLHDVGHDLKQQQELLEIIEKSANLGHWHVNLADNTIHWSDQVYVIHGLKKENFTPDMKSAIEFYHEDDRAYVRDMLNKTIQDKEPFEFELRLMRKDGAIITVQSVGHPELDAKGNVIAVFGIFQDITERKKVEAEILRSNQELDDFAYIASHDLKEPLRGIYNHAMLLKDGYDKDLDAEGLHKLDRVLYLAERMERLISDLLYYSRLGHGEQKLEIINLQEIMADVCEMMADYQDADIILQKDLPDIKCDRVRITELYRNLITNAIKYNDADRKRVEIGVMEELSAEGASTPVLYVRDNGIGIDKNFHDDIFKIFKRLHKKGAYGGGTGSGLTFVKKIIDHHGGRIWLSSAPGKGSTFYFTLGGR